MVRLRGFFFWKKQAIYQFQRPFKSSCALPFRGIGVWNDRYEPILRTPHLGQTGAVVPQWNASISVPTGMVKSQWMYNGEGGGIFRPITWSRSWLFKPMRSSSYYRIGPSSNRISLDRTISFETENIRWDGSSRIVIQSKYTETGPQNLRCEEPRLIDHSFARSIFWVAICSPCSGEVLVSSPLMLRTKFA